MNVMESMMQYLVDSDIAEIEDTEFPKVGEYWVFSRGNDTDCEETYFETLEDALEGSDSLWENENDNNIKYAFIGRLKILEVNEDNTFNASEWLEIAKCYKGGITMENL